MLARASLGPEHAGLRMDRAVMEALGLPSRNRARKELKAGRLLVDGQRIETSRVAWAGAQLSLLAPEHPPPVLSRTIPIAYSDEHLAAMVKPAGLVVSGNRGNTLARALPFNLPTSDAEDALPYARPVHRLDARTSGLVLVARSLRAQVALGRAFEERRVRKRYRALLGGELCGEGIVQRAVDGRDARSRYRAIETSRSLVTEHITAVDLWPETGRRHQLRQHCASLGTPILGDLRYGSRLRSMGMFLCAVELELEHPVHGGPLHIVIEPPDKFATFPAREQRRWARWRG